MLGKKELRAERSQFVVKRNDMVRGAEFSLTSRQYKFINCLISKIRPDDDPRKLYTLDIDELLQVCDIRRGGEVYAEIADLLQRLATKSIWITLRDGIHSLVLWFDLVVIDEKQGNVTVRFSESIAPYLFNLRGYGNYTQYELSDILVLKSVHAQRLYELMRSYYNLEEPIKMSIDELRLRIGTSGKGAKLHNSNDADSWCDYPKFADFRRYVLDPAVQEINLAPRTDMEIEYKLRKVGKTRGYNEIEFSINHVEPFYFETKF